MTPHLIAQTLHLQTVGKEKDETRLIVERLLAFLKEKGRMSLLPEIIKEALKLEKDEKALLTVASDEEATRLRGVIMQAILDMGSRSAPITHKDRNLISGFTLSYKGKRLDYSGKRRLIDLYSALTA